MRGSATPLRYRRINRRNGSIQKIAPENYATRKGIPSNTPLNVSPQRVFRNDFSPIQLNQFKEELGITAEELEKVKRKPKRPLDIEDILGSKIKTSKKRGREKPNIVNKREKDEGERLQFNDPRRSSQMRNGKRENSNLRTKQKRGRRDHDYYLDNST